MGRSRRLSIALLVALAVLVLLSAAGPAAAGPPGATLDLAALQAKLASGPLDGYMITTMQGSTPQQIPVSVLAVVEASTWGKLIMFESTDPAIVDIGGIAAGMSGSPVYVDDGGTDTLVGAVSYGSDFSLRGTGLATPIEYMARAQDAHQSSRRAPVRATVTLDRPVRTATGVVKTLVLAANQKAAGATTPAAGQAVMHPLALAEIGGLPATSAAFKKLAARLEENGLTVVAAPAGGKAPASTPDLEAGSPCGVLFSNGFYWMGVMGTVTYVDGDAAMLFGHPILSSYYGWNLGAGPMQGTLTGATVDGVWPSSWSPFKMMTPADAKGTAVEDRSAGVLAQLGDPAPEYPVTTDVTVNGGAPVVDTTTVTQWFGVDYAPGQVSEWGLEDPGATGYVVSAGLYHALDSDAMAGSGSTTTTVEVSDHTGSYTVSRDNIWDSGDSSYYALGDLAATDAADLVSSLVNDPYGLRDVHIDSVDVTASLSSARRYAGLVDVRLQRALRPGDNDVAVDYYRYGSPDLQTLHATLPMPAGTRLNGYVDVMSAAVASEWGYDDYSDSSPADPPETLAQVAARLEAALTNGDLMVVYTPSGSYDEDSDTPSAVVRATTPTDRVFSGMLSKKTRTVTLRARPRTVALGSPALLRGVVERATGDVEIDIYCRAAGTPDPAVPTTTVTAKEEGGSATFVYTLPPASHNVEVTAEAPALDAGGLPGAAMVTVRVKARVSLAASRSGGRWRYAATVNPKDAGGNVTFQRWAGGRWVALATVAVDGGGKARTSVAAKAAPRVRARFAGNDMNAASAWVVAH